MTGKFVGSALEAGQFPVGGGPRALMEGGGGPIGGGPGEVCEGETEKVKQNQANTAETGKKLNSNFIPSGGLFPGTTHSLKNTYL